MSTKKEENAKPTKKFDKNFVVTPLNIPSINQKGIEKPTVFDIAEAKGIEFRDVQALVNDKKLDIYDSETKLVNAIDKYFKSKNV